MNLRTARKHWKWALLPACIAGGIAGIGTPEDVATVQAAPTPLAVRTALVDVPAALPPRQTLGKLRVDPFAARSWTAPAAPPPVRAAAAPAAPAPPEAPPNPYRFVGTVQQGGTLKIVLAAGERVHVVKGGDVIDQMYRVAAASRNAVTLVYLPLGVEQQLTYVAEAASAPPPSGLPARSLAELRP